MASQTVIENPVINSPYAEPAHHFKFTDDGITNEIAPSRRLSRPFDKPDTGQIAMKVINHYGDEVLKVYEV